MTCNFCGSTLEDNETECPYCGHKVGGTAKKFADNMAEKFSPKADSDAGKVKTAKRKVSSSGAKSSAASKFSSKLSNVAVNPRMILSILAAALVLFIIITMFTVIGTKNKVDDMYQDMLSQFYQMQSTNSALSAQIEKMNSSGASGGSASSNSATVKSKVNITKQPSDCATYIGRTGDIPIFSAEATGNDLAFKWQRLDEASSKWVTLKFDENNVNATYGVHVYNNVSANQGHSELQAHDVTSAAYGSYRCVISDTYGDKATEIVILSERPKD